MSGAVSGQCPTSGNDSARLIEPTRATTTITITITIIIIIITTEDAEPVDGFTAVTVKMRAAASELMCADHTQTLVVDYYTNKH